MEFVSRVIKLKAEAETFDSFLARFSERGFVRKYASSVRNSYPAYQETPQSVERKLVYLRRIASVARAWLRIPFRVAELTVRAPVVLHRLHPPIDAPVTDFLGIPATEIRYRRKVGLNVPGGVLRACKALIAAGYLLRHRPFQKKFIWMSLAPMFDYVVTEGTIDLTGVRTILLHRDRYPDELAIVHRSAELGIPTVRIDYISPLDEFCHQTVSSKYYFYPNDLNRLNFQKFEHNKHVKYVPGGLPSWDEIARYSHKPDRDPKIALFLGQADSDVFIGRDYSYYVEEVLRALAPGVQLYLKVHPLEDADLRERQFKEKGVRVVRHGEIQNFDLISRATFVFSVHSALSFEAKHICDASFLINYFPEMAPHADYKGFKGIIDHIKSADELKRVLSGEWKPIPRADFLRRYNPSFPKTRERLKEFVASLK